MFVEISVNIEVAIVIFEPVLPPKIFLLEIICASILLVSYFYCMCWGIDFWKTKLTVKQYWHKNNRNSVLLYLISALFIIILIIMVEFSQCYVG